MKRALLPLLPILALAGCAASYRLDDPEVKQVAPRSVLKLSWQRKLAEPKFMEYQPQEWARATFSADGKLVMVGSSARRFEARRAKDGQLIWAVHTQGPVSSAPLYHPLSQTVFFGADDGKMYAVDAKDGRVKWKYVTQGRVTPRPVYHQGILLFSTSEGRVYALDAATGKWRWQYDRELPDGFTIQGYSGVTLAGDAAFVGFADGYLVALKASSGGVIWTRSLKGGKAEFVDVDATPTVDGDLLLTASYGSGVYAVSLDTGSIRWHHPVDGASAVAVRDGVYYFTAPKVGLVALDRAGRRIFRQAISSGVPTAPLVAGPYVFVGGTESGLFIASARTGRLLQYMSSGKGISAVPAVGHGILVVVTNGGTLLTFRLPGVPRPRRT